MIENWNSAAGVVFFGKGGEIATNRVRDQEIAALALQLAQTSLVYVNARMVQSILNDLGRADRLSSEDMRGLSPLFYMYIIPYGPLRAGFRRAHQLRAGGCMSVILGIPLMTDWMNTRPPHSGVHSGSFPK